MFFKVLKENHVLGAKVSSFAPKNFHPSSDVQCNTAFYIL